ncbi:DKNYY domain-containing protein [Budviciaceae bacterium BWR-B9]|uniref:DKNYY domain-containing protein n=1 Tax=Limnobaculum allomyrinae TaxID=2791986 RepID=A0ABS1IPY0_9GAMM|nr:MULTISPECIES: DKNYY domain-containing protein [Limnobaculum]MBK5143596.1 DKNYY domain-containing protein [Limnobaculum allomyrinae]MBV7691486.1 DKNYY domain-containing protein [Limnobaculum sp. M2-1]
MKVSILISIIALWVFQHSAQACSPAFIEYRYKAKNGMLLYEKTNINQTPSEVNRLKNVNLKAFHRVHSLSKNNKNWIDGVRFFGDPNYFTDNVRVFFDGEILTNSPEEPAVDAKSFTQPFDNLAFAVDKFSIYYQGKRSDNNTGISHVDLATLKLIDSYIMMDKNNLYHAGQYIGVSKGFQVLKSKAYGDGASCHHGDNIISRNMNKVFVDGIPISADADTFKIERWMPNILLDYSDKNGLHSYYYNNTEQEVKNLLAQDVEYLTQGFYLSRSKVYYTQSQNRKTREWQLTEIPDANPEFFKVINQRVATDENHLYILKGEFDSQSQLSLQTMTLNSPPEQTSMPYHIEPSNIYFINQGGVQKFTLDGEFISLSDYFGHDDRHIYIFGPSYTRTPARQIKTNDIHKIQLTDPDYAYSNLLTAEGIYLYDGGFQATPK